MTCLGIGCGGREQWRVFWKAILLKCLSTSVEVLRHLYSPQGQKPDWIDVCVPKTAPTPAPHPPAHSIPQQKIAEINGSPVAQGHWPTANRKKKKTWQISSAAQSQGSTVGARDVALGDSQLYVLNPEGSGSSTFWQFAT